MFVKADPKSVGYAVWAQYFSMKESRGLLLLPSLKLNVSAVAMKVSQSKCQLPRVT